MKTLVLVLTLVFASTGCNQDLSPLNLQDTSYNAGGGGGICLPAPGLFDNFEAPAIGYLWSGGPTLSSIGYSTSVAHSCKTSFVFKNGGGTSWGHWFGTNGSSLNQGGGPITTCAGATTFDAWFKSDQTVSFDFHVVEGTTAGADGEDWSYKVTVVAGPWQHVNVPLSAFTSGGGNGVFDTQSLQSWWVYYNYSPYPAHTLYIDDISFLP